MPYTIDGWRNRLAERSDISTALTHLTRGTGDSQSNHTSALMVLLSILKQQKIKGSTTESGFISGSRKAVCFQDAPPQFLAQNVYFEKKYRQADPAAKVRYLAVGISFPKTYAFGLGARPVIYDRRADAKNYLPKSQWWRIVNLDIEDEDRMIDWTHEREWRSPGDFKFERSEATVLLPNHILYKNFVNRCRIYHEEKGVDILKGIRGIIDMHALLY